MSRCFWKKTTAVDGDKFRRCACRTGASVGWKWRGREQVGRPGQRRSRESFTHRESSFKVHSEFIRKESKWPAGANAAIRGVLFPLCIFQVKANVILGLNHSRKSRCICVGPFWFLPHQLCICALVSWSFVCHPPCFDCPAKITTGKEQ